MKIKIILVILFFACLVPVFGHAQTTSTQSVIDKITDSDADGLTDDQEINIFKTDPANADTDNDGYLDGDEVKYSYDPNNSSEVKLQKKITVVLKKQELSYFLGQYKLDTFSISTGKATTPTPVGIFKIYNKIPKAWSRSYGLWMPFWMAFTPTGSMGVHELPIWPGGKREGTNHLGKPVSHGCIRLGIDSAKLLYDWALIGTPVIITKN